jgi:hypothetical protein
MHDQHFSGFKSHIKRTTCYKQNLKVVTKAKTTRQLLFYRYLFHRCRLYLRLQLNGQVALATIVTNCDKAHSLHVAHLIIIGFAILYILTTNAATTATATTLHIINGDIILYSDYSYHRK